MSIKENLDKLNITGVHYSRRSKKYFADIWIDAKQILLGTSFYLAEAVQFRLDAELKYRGEISQNIDVALIAKEHNERDAAREREMQEKKRLNNENRLLNTKNTSGVKGVSCIKSGSRYSAVLTKNYKVHNFGSSKSLVVAAILRLKGEQDILGKVSQTNIDFDKLRKIDADKGLKEEDIQSELIKKGLPSDYSKIDVVAIQNPNRKNICSDEELLEAYKELAKELNKTPSAVDLDKHFEMKSYVFINRFGSMNNLQIAANLEPNQNPYEEYSKESCIRILKEIHKEYGRLGLKDFEEVLKKDSDLPHISTFYKKFNSHSLKKIWDEVLD